jgi:flagellar assembly protein FliH
MTLVKAVQVSALGRRIRLGPDAPSLDVVEPSAGDLRLIELEEALRVAQDREKALEASIKQGEHEALERGRIEGEESAVARLERDWDEQRESFREALADCARQIDCRFAELESFALDLAESALSRLVGDDASHRELLAAAISHHVGALGTDTVLAIHVSPDDVPDAADIVSALPAALASRIRVTTGLEAGACRVELLSGSLDIGLRSQVARLAATLERLRA